MDDVKTAVVIPAYNVANSLHSVILSVPDTIDYIIVVDDKCPHSSGKQVEHMGIKNLFVLYHEHNQGVGGAMRTGYKKALDLGCDIVVKIDGDGQMDPGHLNALIDPLIKNEADYVKGNRFHDLTSLKSMPKTRLFGNSVLSFLVKMASGYWNIIDPTNGYTAIHRRVLEKLNLEKISKGYFFESDMLIHLHLLHAVVQDLPIPARYTDEPSSLSITKAVFQFPPRLIRGFTKRIFFKYFIYDFNMASLYILIGLPVFLVSVVWGVLEWIDSALTGEPRTAGTIMLVALPIIISFQMLLQAIHIDIHSIPKK